MIERLEHGSRGEAEKFALDVIRNVSPRQHWMAVVWTELDGVVEFTRTTFQFPKNKFTDALGQLSLDLAVESKASNSIPDPLPSATPMVDSLYSQKQPIPEDEEVLDEMLDEGEDDVE